MENSFKSIIDSSGDILIVLPNKPYLDEVASGLSVYLSLIEAKKNVSVYSSGQMIAEFSRLVAVDKIASELGSKNLEIKFVNYDPEHVDKVSYDIDNNQFKLTIAPKSSFKAPTKEQVKLDYAGFSADLLILIGGANDSHFSILNKEEVKSAKIIHLGTKLLEITTDIEVLSFAHPASSTSEIVSMLIKESGLPVNEDIATNLVAGIEDQSKSFQSQNVTADTFMIFAELLKMGGKRTQKTLPQRFPQGSIPTKPYTQKVVAEENKTMVNQVEEEIPLPDEVPQDIPQAWSEPKIFTGTSIS